MATTLLDLRFLRVHDGTTYFILLFLNHSEGEASLKTWMSMRKRYGKSSR